jgi:hypothetical protein
MLSILPFDRHRVRIRFLSKPSLVRPLLGLCLKSIQILSKLPVLMPIVKSIQAWHPNSIVLDLSTREYALALLLTAAENQWLTSELNIFIDRTIRRQSIEIESIDS